MWGKWDNYYRQPRKACKYEIKKKILRWNSYVCGYFPTYLKKTRQDWPSWAIKSDMSWKRSANNFSFHYQKFTPRTNLVCKWLLLFSFALYRDIFLFIANKYTNIHHNLLFFFNFMSSYLFSKARYFTPPLLGNILLLTVQTSCHLLNMAFSFWKGVFYKLRKSSSNDWSFSIWQSLLQLQRAHTYTALLHCPTTLKAKASFFVSLFTGRSQSSARD